MAQNQSVERMERGERLKRARKAAGLSQYAAALRLRVNRDVISRWENGHVSPTLEHLKAVVALYGVQTDWLMTGQPRLAEPRAAYNVGQLQELEMAAVAIVGVISAGGLVEAWQEDLGTLEVPRSVLREAPRAFGLRVNGSSLASEWINDGSIVVVDPDAPFVDGRIYAVRVDGGEVAARRVYDAGRVLKLVTGDGQVDEYSKRSVAIIGRVRWSFREH